MIIFYLFPFFVRALMKRFNAQFEPQDNGWLYLPEHRARTEILTEVEYQRYKRIFKQKLISNTVIAIIALIALTYWILFVRITYGYFSFGVFIGTAIYFGAYINMMSQFYNPHKKTKFNYGLLGIGVFAFLGYFNYKGWAITREDSQKVIGKFMDDIGLTALIDKDPYIAFGVLILLLFAISITYGRLSLWFRPASNKKRKQVTEERNAHPKEKPWDKEMRVAQEKEKLSKKEKKRRKKEMKKQGKVFPKKYKGETE